MGHMSSFLFPLRILDLIYDKYSLSGNVWLIVLFFCPVSCISCNLCQKKKKKKTREDYHRAVSVAPLQDGGAETVLV